MTLWPDWLALSAPVHLASPKPGTQSPKAKAKPIAHCVTGVAHGQPSIAGIVLASHGA
jgi:hypothetical protein